MKKGLYCIRDVLVGFSQPFEAQHEPVAIRSFAQVANDSGSYVNTNPKDFALYHVGTIDSDTGEITPVVPVRHVVEAVDLIEQK